eukprot:2526719-Pleurochrysis_carterae.AAC.1
MEVPDVALRRLAVDLTLAPCPRVALIKVVHAHLLRDARCGLGGDASEAMEDMIESSKVCLRCEEARARATHTHTRARTHSE